MALALSGLCLLSTCARDTHPAGPASIEPFFELTAKRMGPAYDAGVSLLVRQGEALRPLLSRKAKSERLGERVLALDLLAQLDHPDRVPLWRQVLEPGAEVSPLPGRRARVVVRSSPCRVEAQICQTEVWLESSRDLVSCPEFLFIGELDRAAAGFLEGRLRGEGGGHWRASRYPAPVRALGLVGSPEHVPSILRSASASDTADHIATMADACASLGPDVVPLLVGALHSVVAPEDLLLSGVGVERRSKSNHRRMVAACALGRLREPSATFPLLWALAWSGEVAVQLASAEALLVLHGRAALRLAVSLFVAHGSRVDEPAIYESLDTLWRGILALGRDEVAARRDDAATGGRVLERILLEDVLAGFDQPEPQDNGLGWRVFGGSSPERIMFGAAVLGRGDAALLAAGMPENPLVGVALARYLALRWRDSPSSGLDGGRWVVAFELARREPEMAYGLFLRLLERQGLPEPDFGILEALLSTHDRDLPNALRILADPPRRRVHVYQAIRPQVLALQGHPRTALLASLTLEGSPVKLDAAKLLAGLGDVRAIPALFDAALHAKGENHERLRDLMVSLGSAALPILDAMRRGGELERVLADDIALRIRRPLLATGLLREVMARFDRRASRFSGKKNRNCEPLTSEDARALEEVRPLLEAGIAFQPASMQSRQASAVAAILALRDHRSMAALAWRTAHSPGWLDTMDLACFFEPDAYRHPQTAIESLDRLTRHPLQPNELPKGMLDAVARRFRALLGDRREIEYLLGKIRSATGEVSFRYEDHVFGAKDQEIVARTCEEDLIVPLLRIRAATARDGVRVEELPWPAVDGPCGDELLLAACARLGSECFVGLHGVTGPRVSVRWSADVSRALRGGDMVQKLAALDFTRWLGGQDALPLVRASLDDPEEEIRAQAVEALGSVVARLHRESPEVVRRILADRMLALDLESLIRLRPWLVEEVTGGGWSCIACRSSGAQAPLPDSRLRRSHPRQEQLGAELLRCLFLSGCPLTREEAEVALSHGSPVCAGMMNFGRFDSVIEGGVEFHAWIARQGPDSAARLHAELLSEDDTWECLVLARALASARFRPARPDVERLARLMVGLDVATQVRPRRVFLRAAVDVSAFVWAGTSHDWRSSSMFYVRGEPCGTPDPSLWCGGWCGGGLDCGEKASAYLALLAGFGAEEAHQTLAAWLQSPLEAKASNEIAAVLLQLEDQDPGLRQVPIVLLENPSAPKLAPEQTVRH